MFDRRPGICPTALAFTFALIATSLPRSASAVTLPPGFIIVGTHPAGSCGPAGPASIGQFTMSGLTANKPVEIRFVECFSGVWNLSAAVGTGSPTANCSTGIVGTTADNSGDVTLTILGSLHLGSCTPSPTGGCVEVWDDDGSGTLVHVGSLRMACMDRDGCGGLGASDVSIWLDTYFCGNNSELGDFDFSSVLGAPDLSILLTQFFNACNVVSPPEASCLGGPCGGP